MIFLRTSLKCQWLGKARLSCVSTCMGDRLGIPSSLDILPPHLFLIKEHYYIHDMEPSQMFISFNKDKVSGVSGSQSHFNICGSVIETFYYCAMYNP